MNPNGVYFFHIFERELKSASAEFGGRRYEQDGDALYWDQDGYWYYSYSDRLLNIDWEDSVVTVNSESLHYGRGVEALLKSMDSWLNHMEFDGELPPILRGYAYVSVDTGGGEMSESKQSLLERLRNARKKS